MTMVLPIERCQMVSRRFRHSGESRNPAIFPKPDDFWMPAFAGMTMERPVQ
jgi:hypothetical protein